MADYCDLYFAEKSKTWSTTTRHYRKYFNRDIIKLFGDFPIQDITRAQAQGIFNNMPAGYARQNLESYFIAIISHAVENDVRLNGIRLKRVKFQKNGIRFYTPQEISRIISFVPEEFRPYY